jgi:hypothetical protein
MAAGIPAPGATWAGDGPDNRQRPRKDTSCRFTSSLLRELQEEIDVQKSIKDHDPK